MGAISIVEIVIGLVFWAFAFYKLWNLVSKGFHTQRLHTLIACAASGSFLIAKIPPIESFLNGINNNLSPLTNHMLLILATYGLFGSYISGFKKLRFLPTITAVCGITIILLFVFVTSKVETIPPEPVKFDSVSELVFSALPWAYVTVATIAAVASHKRIDAAPEAAVFKLDGIRGLAIVGAVMGIDKVIMFTAAQTNQAVADSLYSISKVTRLSLTIFAPIFALPNLQIATLLSLPKKLHNWFYLNRLKRNLDKLGIGTGVPSIPVFPGNSTRYKLVTSIMDQQFQLMHDDAPQWGQEKQALADRIRALFVQYGHELETDDYNKAMNTLVRIGKSL